MSAPYYQEDGITIYHGDCREILPSLPTVDLVLTDPPYGIAHPTDYKARGRDNLAQCTDYVPVHGDGEPFDPSHLLALNIPLVLVWDKERPDDLDQATCELAWTNFVKGVRRFRYMWHGMLRDGSESLFHPTQKPVALSKWVLTLRWTPSDAVLDPYMGAGGTLRAAKDLGRSAIGIEIEERYCEIAANRLRQEVLCFG